MKHRRVVWGRAGQGRWVRVRGVDDGQGRWVDACDLPLSFVLLKLQGSLAASGSHPTTPLPLTLIPLLQSSLAASRQQVARDLEAERREVETGRRDVETRSRALMEREQRVGKVRAAVCVCRYGRQMNEGTFCW